MRGILNMICRDGGASLAIVLFFLAALGLGATAIMKEKDNEIEESVEQLMEDKIESFLGLEDDELEGAIDLSPSSPESLIQVVSIF